AVEEVRVVGWIRRRAVDLLARRLRRQVAVLGEERARDRACDPFETLDAAEWEAAEKQRAMGVEPALHLVAMRSRPFREVDTFHRRPHDQRQRIAVDDARLDELCDVDGLTAHRAEPRR